MLAPMAGITDGTFALKLIPYGFDTVTIGGYNIDDPTIAAGEKILKRGRNEFSIPQEDIFNSIEKEVKLIKNKSPSDSNIKISTNLRAISPDPIIEISKIKDLDIIEINCHCRQEELLNINCGQNMLKDDEFLEAFISEITKKSKSEVSVKIRANVEGVDTLKIAKIIKNSKANYIHVDAMKPGFNHCDLDIIKKIANIINQNDKGQKVQKRQKHQKNSLKIIGNNSINSIKRAEEMLNAGASGISIGRAAINGKLNFNLKSLNIIKN